MSRPPKNGPALDLIVAAMPGTILQLAAKSGFSREWVAKQIKDPDNKRALHIAGWEPSYHGRYEAIHAAGSGVDAPRPRKVKRAIAPIAKSAPARYDDTVMPRAFFGGRAN